MVVKLNTVLGMGYEVQLTRDTQYMLMNRNNYIEIYKLKEKEAYELQYEFEMSPGHRYKFFKGTKLVADVTPNTNIIKSLLNVIDFDLYEYVHDASVSKKYIAISCEDRVIIKNNDANMTDVSVNLQNIIGTLLSTVKMAHVKAKGNYLEIKYGTFIYELVNEDGIAKRIEGRPIREVNGNIAFVNCNGVIVEDGRKLERQDLRNGDILSIQVLEQLGCNLLEFNTGKEHLFGKDGEPGWYVIKAANKKDAFILKSRWSGGIN